MCRLAQVGGIAARLQPSAQGQQLIALRVKLDSLVKTAVCHPDVAIQVDCQPMGHQELVFPPAGKNLPCVLHMHTVLMRELADRMLTNH